MLEKQRGFSFIEVIVAVSILTLTLYSLSKLSVLKETQLTKNNNLHHATMLLKNIEVMIFSLSIKGEGFLNGYYLNTQGNIKGPYKKNNNQQANIDNVLNNNCAISECTLSTRADYDMAMMLPIFNKYHNAELSISCVDSDTNDSFLCSYGSQHTLIFSWVERDGNTSQTKLEILY